MASSRFVIDQIFDLPSRAGLLVSGTLASGEIVAGTQLIDIASGKPILVLAVELATPRRHGVEGAVTLLLPREHQGQLLEGGILEGA